MGKDELFKKRLFGGYEKDDVMDYVRSLENEKETVRILANKETVNLKARLEKANKEKEELVSELDAFREKIKGLQEELEAKQVTGAPDEKRVLETEEICRKLEAEKKDIWEKLQGARLELEEGNRRYQEMQEALANAEAGKIQMQELLIKCKELEQQVEALNEEKNNFQAENNSLKESAQKMKEEYETAFAKMQSDEDKSIIDMNQETEMLKEKIIELQKELSAAAVINSNLQEELQRKPEENNDILLKQEEQFIGLEAEKNALLQENERLQETCRYFQEENMRLQTEEIARNEEKMHLLEERERIKKESLNSLEQERLCIMDTLRRIEERNRSLSDENIKLQDENQELLNLYRYLQDENSYLLDENSELQDNLEWLRKTMHNQPVYISPGRNRLPLSGGYAPENSRKQYYQYQPGGSGMDIRQRRNRYQKEYGSVYDRRHMKEDSYYPGYENFFYNSAPPMEEEAGEGTESSYRNLKEESLRDSDIPGHEEERENIFDNSQRDLQELFREVQDKIQQFFE